MSETKATLEEVARRAVACKGWKWMVGMSVAVPDTLDGGEGGYYRIYIASHVPEADAYPNFSDPATMGCLLHIVREAWNVPDLSAIRSAFKDGSVVWSFCLTQECREQLGLADGYLGGATEAEALVAALEVAQ